VWAARNSSRAAFALGMLHMVRRVC
jgi:hypothetical protein